ncbi:ABC transporter permease [Muribaculum intestinale]|uniref:ABC transporter permease n=1 Tax=Muribaculum intestinale TaxID=1796646 RepID=UPI0025B701C6|nr:ABC transporter permease [Muribaculum intestinale]
MPRIFSHIRQWWTTLYRSLLNGYRLIWSDKGVMLFFIALPLLYPVTYTLIYNPEVVTDLPMAVVDNSRTAESRELVRMIDATQYIGVAGYASSLQEARDWAKERKVYSILVIPEDYARKIGRSEQTVLPLYTDMSLLLRYRSILFAMTDLQLQLGADIRTEALDRTPAAFVTAPQESVKGVDTQSFFLGDPTQGFASFIMVGLVVLILQQSAVLGVMMLAGGSRERRRINGGIDPQEIEGPLSASILGRALAVFTIYMPLTVYILHYIPVMFSLPHIGATADYLLFMAPMLLASIFLGQVLSVMISERESCFPVFVFTSVLFLFLSGLTWPRTAMNPLWSIISGFIPATWGVEGFVGINANGATLADMSTQYGMLWVLTVAYFIIACFTERWARSYDRRHFRLPSVP